MEIDIFLKKVEELISKEIPDEYTAMQNYARFIAGYYARLSIMRVELEQKLILKRGTFSRVEASKTLKQYQYKDEIDMFCIGELAWIGRVDALLKPISKHLEILQTLLSCSREEMKKLNYIEG